MRMRKSVRPKKSTPRAKKPTSSTTSVGRQAAALAVIGVVAAAAMLYASRDSSPRPDAAAAARQPDKASHARATNASEAPPAAVNTMIAADTTPAPVIANESATSGPTQTISAVTITGCLENAHDAFRLKDTSGADAPKARSWKSGFLKKSTPSIEVVDAANRLQLPAHVGQRVSVTGVLVDREMKARSLKRIAASCDAQVAKL
jgi:hypothetical protein